MAKKTATNQSTTKLQFTAALCATNIEVHMSNSIGIKDVIIVIAITVVLAVALILGVVGLMIYALEKDQSKIKKIVESASISGLSFSSCYENKCFYQLTLGDCKKQFVLRYDSELENRLNEIKSLSGEEVCRDSGT